MTDNKHLALKVIFDFPNTFFQKPLAFLVPWTSQDSFQATKSFRCTQSIL